MPRKPIDAFQEMQRGVDPNVLVDLGYKDIPSHYTGEHDVVASAAAEEDAVSESLELDTVAGVGETAVKQQVTNNGKKKPSGPRKRYDPATQKPASLASMSGRQRAFAEVSDSWETK